MKEFHDPQRPVKTTSTCIHCCHISYLCRLGAYPPTVYGYEVSAPNGWSEFGAIYVGVFIAQALLFGLAISRVSDAVLGDLCAVFLLLQPVGRLLPFIRYGAPTGLLRLLMVLELFGGIALLLVRPGA